MIDPRPFTRGQQARRPLSPMGLAMMAALCDAMEPPTPAAEIPEPDRATWISVGVPVDRSTFDAVTVDPRDLQRRPALSDVARPAPRTIDEGRAARDQLLRSVDDAAEFLEQIADALSPLASLAALVEWKLRRELSESESEREALAAFDREQDQGEEGH